VICDGTVLAGVRHILFHLFEAKSREELGGKPLLGSDLILTHLGQDLPQRYGASRIEAGFTHELC